jgi:hypothetical protein
MSLNDQDRTVSFRNDVVAGTRSVPAVGGAQCWFARYDVRSGPEPLRCGALIRCSENDQNSEGILKPWQPAVTVPNRSAVR